MILLKNKQYYYWNECTVSPWINYDEEMNYKFSEINNIIFKNLIIKKNQSILDIGCGSGFTSFQLSKKVGVNGSVKAVDISKPLLELFVKKYKNVNNLSCLRIDLQNTNLEKNSFDHAVSRFGVMFFEYPLQAFKHIYKSLKKKGTLTFVCWTNFRCNQFFTIPAYSVFSKTNIDLPKITNKPGPFAFKDKSYVQNLLKKSGFRRIFIKNLKTKLQIQNVKTDTDIMLEIGIGAQMLRENNINKNTSFTIRKDINTKLKKLFENQNYYKANILLVNAIK